MGYRPLTLTASLHQAYVCDCGGLVWDVAAHNRWHTALSTRR